MTIKYENPIHRQSINGNFIPYSDCKDLNYESFTPACIESYGSIICVRLSKFVLLHLICLLSCIHLTTEGTYR